jgi:hypothetical protein
MSLASIAEGVAISMKSVSQASHEGELLGPLGLAGFAGTHTTGTQIMMSTMTITTRNFMPPTQLQWPLGRVKKRQQQWLFRGIKQDQMRVVRITQRGN